jgi:hypothetical protein
MSSNTTQRRAQVTIVASEVEAFRTWFMVADCGQCGPRARRMSDYPVDITMQRLILRLRCRVCHKPPVTVAIDNAAKGHLRRVVKAWGPGSYG